MSNTEEKAISFVPHWLLNKISKNLTELRFLSVVVFADVSGFTKMSEQLATIGKEGAEELTSILNNYFSEMISSIQKNGGFVGKFGGDAMTVFYPAKNKRQLPRIIKIAVKNALELQTRMDGFQDIKTKAGGFSLGMKIGVASGEVLFKVVGNPDQQGCEFLLAGAPLDQAAEAEHHGSSGEVIISFRSAVKAQVIGEEINSEFLRVDKAFKPVVRIFKQPEPEKTRILLEIAKSFIDPPVYKRLELGLGSVGEIRRVSVIFISFSGLDYDYDTDVSAKLDELYDWIFNTTRKYNGSINKVDMGDKGSKVILTFGTPVAHENDEELAVRCGLELTNESKFLIKLGIVQKIGIATGVVFAGEVGAPSRQEYTVMGTTVNLAARIMANSSEGELFVDEETYNKTNQAIEYSEPKHVQFKGIKELLPIFKALKPHSIRKNNIIFSDKPLIGREDELAESEKIIQAVLRRKLQTMIILGDAGIGKSKLSGHIFQLLKSSEFGIFGGESLSYARNSPFVPWHSIMTRIMGIDSFADPKQQFNQLCKVIKDSDPDNYFRLPIISEFLGFDCEDNNITKHFDGQLRRENLFDFIIQLLRFTAKENPICLVFEDSQWIDSSSISLIAYCMRNLLDLPIFLIIIRRLFDADAELKFVREIEDSGLSTTIELKELTRDETEKIILQQLKADQLSTELLDFVYRSSHGNPTFTEQFAENLLLKDRIKLVLSPENKQVFIELQGELNESDVPDSLNSLIMSQIDNLDPRSKLTVKIAAAVGSQLKTEIVTGAYPVKMSRDDIVNSLEQLELKDVLHKVDTNEFNYIFKNLVTRDVAYGSLLFSHRREYHKRIAYNIENLNEGNLVKFYEELAWHFSQSTEDKQALNYLSKAGDKAYDLYANESALSYYTQAIDRTSTEQNPKERYNLLNMRSKVYSALGRREPQKQDLDELLELTDIRKDMKSKVGVLSNIALYYNMVNKLDEMKTVIDQAQEILETFDFPFGRIAINNYSGRLHFVKHEFNEALQYFKLCMVDAEKYNDQKGLSVAFTNCGMTYKAMGDFERALDYYKKSISIDLEIGNKKSEALNLGNTGVIYHQQGDIESAAVAYRNALRIAREIGSKQVQAYFLGNLAYIFQLKGERKQALGSHEELLKLTQKMGYFKGQVLSLNNIGAWYQEFGDCKKAIHYYGQAFEIATCSNLKGLIPMILLNKGLALHYQGELSKANEILNQGLRKSIEINSKPTEDYARRYLGFVLIDQQKLDDAKYQFVAAESIAQSIGSKASLASVKVGLGTIDMMNDLRDRYLIQEGISEAEKLGDQEVLLKGLINQAKLMIRGKEKTDDILTILNKAYGVADKSGLTCDLNIIKGLIESVTP